MLLPDLVAQLSNNVNVRPGTTLRASCGQAKLKTMTVGKLMRTIRSLAVLAGALALFAATPVSAARMCPMIWRPVCAIARDGHHKTFANRCIAHAAHARIKHGGACRPGRR